MNIDEGFLPVTSAHSLSATQQALAIPALPPSAPASSLLQLAWILLLYVGLSECPLRELSSVVPSLRHLPPQVPSQAHFLQGTFIS